MTRLVAMRALHLAATLAVSCAIAIAVLPGPARADDDATLGRIFLTPEQRRLLDQRRLDPATNNGSDLPADLLPARSRATRRVVLNGVIRRGGEESLVWINGAPAGRTAVPDAQNRVTVEVGRAGAAVRLKPGQAWDSVSRQVTDCIRCGQAPPPAEPQPTAGLPAPAETAVVSAATPADGLVEARESP